MSARKPLIAVVGATGQQGGAVVQALLRRGGFRIRALTRDPLSSKSTKLAALPDTEVVAADLDDIASMVKALQGVDAMFLVTDFLQGAKCNAETEIQQGKNGADAAKQAGVKHLVFSTLEDPRKVVPAGEFPEVYPGRIVPPFESKAEIQEYIVERGIPATFLLTAGFFENFINLPKLWLPPRQYAFDNVGPATRHPMHAARDIGESAAVVFASPDKYLGQTIPVVADWVTMEAACKTVRSTAGINMHYLPLSDDQFWRLPLPDDLAKGISNMWRYFRDYADVAAAKRSPDRAVYQGQNLEEWCQDKFVQGALKSSQKLNPALSVLMLLMLRWFRFQEQVLRRKVHKQRPAVVAGRPSTTA